jgi:hypothetical protein
MSFEIVDKETPTDVSTDVITGYSTITQRVSNLVEQADEILLKDPQSDVVAAEARTCRLDLMRVRTDTERLRKQLLQPIDLRRKAISGAAAIITDAVAQREAKLSTIEQAAEDRKEQRRKALHDARYAELAAIVSGDALAAYALVDLGSKSKNEFTDILNAARTIAAEIEAKRIADEAEAKRLADEAEAKRLTDEAEAKRLTDEAEAKRLADEAQRKAELEAQAAAAKEADAKRAAAEAENAALRAKIEEMERKANAEAEAKRVKAEAEAAEKKRALDEQLRIERERIAAEQALAVAPDREKLTAFIDSLAGLAPPEMATKSGKTAATCLVGILTKARKDMATYVINLR